MPSFWAYQTSFTECELPALLFGRFLNRHGCHGWAAEINAHGESPAVKFAQPSSAFLNTILWNSTRSQTYAGFG
jgi:hypothetical protein